MNLKYFLYSIFDESLFVMRKANLISQFLTDYVKVIFKIYLWIVTYLSTHGCCLKNHVK